MFKDTHPTCPSATGGGWMLVLKLYTHLNYKSVRVPELCSYFMLVSSHEVNTLISARDTKWPLFRLKCLDPGSGRQFLRYDMAPTQIPVFYPRNLVLRMASFLGIYLFQNNEVRSHRPRVHCPVKHSDDHLLPVCTRDRVLGRAPDITPVSTREMSP